MKFKLPRHFRILWHEKTLNRVKLINFHINCFRINGEFQVI